MYRRVVVIVAVVKQAHALFSFPFFFLSFSAYCVACFSVSAWKVPLLFPRAAASLIGVRESIFYKGQWEGALWRLSLVSHAFFLALWKKRKRSACLSSSLFLPPLQPALLWPLSLSFRRSRLPSYATTSLILPLSEAVCSQLGCLRTPHIKTLAQQEPNQSRFPQHTHTHTHTSSTFLLWLSSCLARKSSTSATATSTW